MLEPVVDGVVVIGGGNAAICAALAAADEGARVVVLERASLDERGGNSKYTRNIRVAHPAMDAMGGAYEPDELLQDLVAVTGSTIDMDLARMAVNESATIPAWMEAHGARWQPPFRGALQLDRTNRFFLGGGKALLNKYFEDASKRGVKVLYEHRVERIEATSAAVNLEVSSPGGTSNVSAPAVVVASGGFESNIEWLRRYWGDAVDNFIIRGTQHNDGRLLQLLIEQGAMQRGNAHSFHSVACDARAPRHDGGIATRVDAIPFGVVVNRDAQRFSDEGIDIWPKRYATWGSLIARQPDQRAYVIFDSSALGRFIPSAFPPLRAPTVRDLATMCGLDPERLEATIATFNRSTDPSRRVDFSRLDGSSTQGLQPAKSNWAAPLVHAPFYAYPVVPGVTFTYLGLAVDDQGRVLREGGDPWPRLFAAGEVMAGNILHTGYLAGFGMTIGTVFGRLAGRQAAGIARAA